MLQRVAHLTKTRTRSWRASYAPELVEWSIRTSVVELDVWIYGSGNLGKLCLNKHHCLGGLQVSDIARRMTVMSSRSSSTPQSLGRYPCWTGSRTLPTRVYLLSGFTVRHSESNSHQEENTVDVYLSIQPTLLIYSCHMYLNRCLGSLTNARREEMEEIRGMVDILAGSIRYQRL